MILGAHCSTGGGIHTALQRAAKIGAASCQIFCKNNMQWLGRPYLPDELAAYAREATLHPAIKVFGHTGYLINLGAPPSPNRAQSLKSLIQEIGFATDLGLPFLVLHPGAHLGQGEEIGIQQIIAGLDEAIAATPDSPVRIALETTAGQGTCLGHHTAHLAAIYDGVQQPKRLGLCLDTAHLFEAGHDLRSPKGWDDAIQEIDSLIGMKQILCVHLNDSKTALASRVDRHAGIGQGHIGRDAFRHILKDKRFAKIPGCLETPKSADLHEDMENLAILRELADT